MINVLDVFNLPKKYTRSFKDNTVEVLLHKYWIRNLLRCHRVPEFIFHEKYSNDEVQELFKQGESLSLEWCHTNITILPKDNKMVVPLPRARLVKNEDIKLSLSQIVQYVAQENYKEIWKDAYKKFSYDCCIDLSQKNEGVPCMNYNDIIKEIILRMYGLTVFKLGDSHFSQDNNCSPHVNLLNAFAAIETSKAFFIFQSVSSDYTVLDTLNFSPAKLSSPLASPLFVIYQLLHLLRHLNNKGLFFGDITLQDIYIDENLWIKVSPKIRKNIIESDENLREETPIADDSSVKFSLNHFKNKSGCPDKDQCKSDSGAIEELNQQSIAWTYGAISTYDYLCTINRLAGRKMNQPSRNYVMPWISDLSNKLGSNWRDLTKSKFRLNKGDCQLDRTFQIESTSTQVPHHIPEILSEITYYVYLARITPRSVLCKYVRPQWVPGEYPASIQRLQQWTPDECIPEFYSDPNVFKSIHSDLGDLQVPEWASSAQDFISHHRSMLESPQVSSMLHHWIDLNFGYKLTGSAAVKAKNVCLSMIDDHRMLRKSGVVQLFSRPHPHRIFPSPYWSKNPPNLNLSSKRLCNDYQDNTCLEDEEPIRNSNISLSKFIGHSKTNTTSVSSNENSQLISLPKDFNPCSMLSSVELIHNFNKSMAHKLSCESRQRDKSKLAHHKLLLLDRRLKQSQIIGCLIVELFLPLEVRVFGIGVVNMSFDNRLEVCKRIAKQHMQSLPLCVQSAIQIIFQIKNKKDETEEKILSPSCCQLPCAHSLLQPLLSNLQFPPLLSMLYSTVTSLQSKDLWRVHQDDFTADINVINKINETKVKSIMSNVEKLSEEGGACLELFVPYFKNLLANSETDVISAWYLFDHVARGLGPENSTKLLLDSVLRLYDWEVAVQTDAQLVHKRIKLYHRSFLLRLIVRFGFQTFLDNFIIPLVEAVGGNHDLDLGKSSCLDYGDGEDCFEDVASPMSPLDEDSSSESDKMKSSAAKDCDDIDLTEEDMFLEEDRRGPKSAKSLQNLLIDNIDAQFSEDKEVEIQPEESTSKFIRESNEGSGWNSRRSFSVIPHFEQGDSLHTKFVSEVCQVSAESLLWLSHRLGPVLTARYLTRNLLRMLGLCYFGTDRLTEDCRTGRLPADKLSASVIHCLKSISELYGEQLIVLQYLPHLIELIGQSKRKMTTNLEGGIIGCLVLLSNILHIITDSTFADILQDIVIRNVVGPCLRIIGSQSLPSGTPGRKALAIKLVHTLSTLVARAPPPQRVFLLQSLQRFFLLFSKALNLSPDACCRSPGISIENSGNLLNKSREDVCGTSPTNLYDFDSSKNKTMDELKEVMSPELAYKSFEPFANFFGEKMMEQSLRNYTLIKQLCNNYLSKKQSNRIPDRFDDQLELECLEPPVETGLQVGSFGNVVVIGNRIDLQNPFGKSSSPIAVEESLQVAASTKSETMNRHLRGNWVAYWEHEIGRNIKDTKLNIKQIKLQTLVGHTNSVRHIVPLASENSIMSAGRDKTVKLWSLRSQGDGSGSLGPQWTYQGHRKSILGCGFSERCRLAVTTDSVVHIWDPWVGRALATLSQPHVPPINTLIVLPPPSPLALSAATDSSIRSLDLRTCSFVNELKVSVSSSALIRCLVQSPSSGWLAIGQASGIITMIDLKMGSVLSQWKAHDAEILQLVAVDNQTLISSSLDQTVCVWNASDGKLKFILKGPSEPVHCLLSFGSEVVSGSTSNRIGVHSSLETGVPAYTSTRLRSDSFKGVLTSMSLLPLNRILLLGADNGNITLIC